MVSSFSRRFVLTSSFAALSATVARPLPAEAGSYVTAFSYLLGGNMILAAAELVEDFLMPSLNQAPQVDMSATNRKLASLADRTTEVARNQDLILRQLAQQRMVMREEVKRGFLNNDVAELKALSQHSQVAISLGDGPARTSVLVSIADRIGEQATKLSTYGVPGVSAYSAAIAVENSVHAMLKTHPRVIRTINEGHRRNLTEILSGQSEDSLPQLIKANTQAIVGEIGPHSPLIDFGRKIPLFAWGQGDTASPTMDVVAYGHTYQGIFYDDAGNLKPRYASYAELVSQVPNPDYNLSVPRHITNVLGIYDYQFQRDTRNPQLTAPKFATRIHTNVQLSPQGVPYVDKDGYPLMYMSDGRSTDQQNQSFVMLQGRARNQYYIDLYYQHPQLVASKTPITPGALNGGTSEQGDVRQFLQDGINGVDKILTAASIAEQRSNPSWRVSLATPAVVG